MREMEQLLLFKKITNKKQTGHGKDRSMRSKKTEKRKEGNNEN